MKKILLYIIIGVLIAGCTSRPTDDGKQAETESQPEPLVRVPTAMDSARMAIVRNRIWAEIAYYLERHSADDEGYELVSSYIERGDSSLMSYVPQQPLSIFNIGRWRGIARSGTGLLTDCGGRMVVGSFDCDTLVGGLRVDTAMVYAGSMTRFAEAEGYGACRLLDDVFYEGHWHQDQRNGYGLGISPTFLHVGQWRNDKFVGERMRYTADRVYGIDLSRYQHEQGRKRYAIDWSRLRITCLGHRISLQRVSGEVDYPVSFAYIKSTEGISIKNRYFMADYLAARNQRIVVGAYHFFSTKQSALAQASFFLQNSCFRRGDLPPMLDLEPSDAQINSMGGVEVMFNEVRKWLGRVEARIGVRPIIYVNQRFVRKYLSEAPELKENYQVWIARYGEYKPDVHLAFWQLSADGRVRGIQGEVDINVFNGYQSQWDDFLREETIR